IRDLNLPPVLEELGLRPLGLLLVARVTGPGTATALAAMVYDIHPNRRVNIIATDDPIAFPLRDHLATLPRRAPQTDPPSFTAAPGERVAAAGAAERRQGSRAGVGSADQSRRGAGEHARPDEVAFHSRLDRAGLGAVRHAELRSVAVLLVPAGHGELRERDLLR